MPKQLQHLYGCAESDIDSLARSLVDGLSLSLEARDSSYWGDYYIDKSGRFTECRLYRNADPLYQPGNDPTEDYWFEADHRDCAALLAVDGLPDVVLAFERSLVTALPKFALLKHTTYDVDE